MRQGFGRVVSVLFLVCTVLAGCQPNPPRLSSIDVAELPTKRLAVLPMKIRTGAYAITPPSPGFLTNQISRGLDAALADFPNLIPVYSAYPLSSAPGLPGAHEPEKDFDELMWTGLAGSTVRVEEVVRFGEEVNAQVVLLQFCRFGERPGNVPAGQGASRILTFMVDVERNEIAVSQTRFETNLTFPVWSRVLRRAFTRWAAYLEALPR